MSRCRRVWYYQIILSLWTLHIGLPVSAVTASPESYSTVPERQTLPGPVNNADVQDNIKAAQKTLAQIIDLLDRIRDRRMLHARKVITIKPPHTETDQIARSALNLRLIVALENNDMKQAFALVNAGADPNTRYQPVLARLSPTLDAFLLSPTPVSPTPNALPIDHGLTAFSIACGAVLYDEGGIGLPEARRRERATFTEAVQAGRSEDVPLVQAMLAHHATVDMPDVLGRTPLIWAVHFGRSATVRLLLDHGADVNWADTGYSDYYRTGGWTPLMHAALSHHSDMMRVLIEHGANVNAQDHNGFTPLMYAAETGRLDMVHLLISCGARINTSNTSGWNALYCALNWGAPEETVRELLKHGADPNIETNAYMTPLMIAHTPNIVALLKQYGARK
jgi:hypothetical protein